MMPFANMAMTMFGALATWACLKYLILIHLLGFLTLPLSHRFLSRTRVVWFSAAPILGLSLLNFVAWLLGQKALGVPYSRASLFVLLAAGLVLALWGYSRLGRVIWRRVRKNRRAILVGEAVFLIAFCFGAALRMYAPEIRDQEKFMDLAFLNSLTSNTQIPPADPWHYSLPINYYYGGYMQMATLAKLSGVRPEIAYNVSVAVIFSFTCLLAFSLAFELTKRVRWALLAVCTVALMGNLDVAAQNIEHMRNASPEKVFAVDWWRPSRVIHDGGGQATINEFPYFSFFLADLHPHMMGIPQVLLFLCAVLNLMRGRRPGLAGFGRGAWRWVRIVLTAWCLGTLAIVNGFDFIAFACGLGVFVFAREWRVADGWKARASLNLMTCLSLLLAVAAIGLFKASAMLQRAYAPDLPPGRVLWSLAWLSAAALAIVCITITVRVWVRDGRPGIAVMNALITWAAIGLVALVLFAPFFANYHAPISGKPFGRPAAGISPGSALAAHIAQDLPVGFVDFRSGTGEFLTVWGTHLTVLLAFLLAATWGLIGRTRGGVGILLWPVAFGIFGLFAGWWGHLVAAVLPFLAFWVPLACVRAGKRSNHTFVHAALFLSLLILFGCEQVYIRDSYGRDLQRMNTLFKFYYPVWILLGVCIPFCLREVLRSADLTRRARWLLTLPGLLLIAWAMEYPVAVTWSRVAHYDLVREGKPDLNGSVYLDEDHPADYRAIEWLRENGRQALEKTRGKGHVPVVLEAVGGGYSYYARVSTYSGLRSVLGWSGHEQVWRGPYPSEIESDVRTIYSNPSLPAVLPLLRKYGVDFVFVGELERKDFAAGLAKFDGLPVAYRDPTGESVVYAVGSR